MSSSEQQLDAHARELADLRHEFDAFTYAVAHDLRAPLRGISGYLDALREDHAAELSPPGQAHLTNALDCAVRMQSMMDDLLQLSRLGRKELLLLPIPLDRLVAEVRRELTAEFPFREIEWRIDALPTVTCDASLLRQVFAALLSNAVKFTRHTPHATIEVWQEKRDSQIAIAVRDNGVGFDPQRATHLFSPFVRLHAPRDFEGSGVGLAKAARIIRRHGGKIWADAAENKGATFYFTLEQPPAVKSGK